MKMTALAGLVLVLALPPAAVAQNPPADEPAPAFSLPPLDGLQATRERPLFAPTRRPDAEAPPAETAVVEESPETVAFDLTGVVMGAETAIAILRNRDTQETVAKRQGEMLENWSLEEIASRHVVLRQEERQVRLELFKPENDANAATPPAFRPNPANLEMPRQRRNSQLTAAQRRAAEDGLSRRPMRRQNRPPRPQNR
jgi:type II secretory pathway component PulC